MWGTTRDDGDHRRRGTDEAGDVIDARGPNRFRQDRYHFSLNSSV